MPTILVVDDEPNVRSSFERLLTERRIQVLTAATGDEAVALVESRDPDVVVMDVQLPGLDGLEAFRQMRRIRPRLPVVIMTGHGTAQTAIEATALGAYDYLLKPFEPGAMLDVIDGALDSARLMNRAVALDPVAAGEGDALVGQDEAMQEVYKAIGRAAATDATVLIRGETGTGKELVARALYQHSRRSGRPLLTVNCVAIPETLLESELFGYERGAFTGATTRRLGKFEQAHGATLFLDEIGDMPLSTQAKILRVLQDGGFQRLGGNDPLRCDVRVLAATNRNLEAAIAAGAFREDLLHRLNVVTIEIPPLRRRRGDIPRLTDYFLRRQAPELGIEPPPLAPGAREFLNRHPWPGNVRELEHCIRRTLIFTQGRAIGAADVERALARRPDEPAATAGDGGDALTQVARRFLEGRPQGQPHRELMDRLDRALVVEALRITGGNQSQAARLLNLARPTLQAKIEKHGIVTDHTVR